MYERFWGWLEAASQMEKKPTERCCVSGGGGAALTEGGALFWMGGCMVSTVVGLHGWVKLTAAHS